MLGFFLYGVGLALNAVAIPGAPTAYLLSVALQAGWRRALWVAICPFLSDIPIIIVSVLLLDKMQDVVPDLVRVIQVIGGLILLFIAYKSWQLVRSGVMFTAADEKKKPALRPRDIVAQAILVNLTSPGPYIFWASVNGPKLLEGLEQSVWHGLAFLVGFYGMFFCGFTLLAFAFSAAGSVNPRVTRLIMYFAVGLIVIFGLQYIATGLGLIA
jgi:threonine/homoserine/homoserine lactone efflux protein